jgi:NTE family protein
MNVITTAPYESFQDWGRGGEILGGLWNLQHGHGLCHGAKFESWMDGELKGKTFADVKNDDGSTRLKMIATDITRQKMLVLPRDLADFQRDDGKAIGPDTFRISRAVRMSMAIPYFFAPVVMTTVADGNPCVIVDGGVLSNFPVWLFDTAPDKDPTRPTFGFRITGGRGVGAGLDGVVAKLGWPIQEGAQIFHTASGAWDNEFASYSTIVRTCPAPAGDLGTTDFARVSQVKNQVVADAKTAAGKFLDGFNLSNYRNTYANTLT